MIKEKTKKQIQAEEIEKLRILYAVCFIGFLLLISIIAINIKADQIVHKFKSPSFNGIGTSSHYLTIENQQYTRKLTIKEEIKALQDEIKRDKENSTLARFMRNLGTVTEIVIPIGTFTF